MDGSPGGVAQRLPVAVPAIILRTGTIRESRSTRTIRTGSSLTLSTSGLHANGNRVERYLLRLSQRRAGPVHVDQHALAFRARFLQHLADRQ